MTWRSPGTPRKSRLRRHARIETAGTEAALTGVASGSGRRFGGRPAAQVPGCPTRADAVAAGLIARSGVKAAEGAETVGSEEPLAEWERELLGGRADEEAVQSSAVTATDVAAAADAGENEAVGNAEDAGEAAAAEDATA